VNRREISGFCRCGAPVFVERDINRRRCHRHLVWVIWHHTGQYECNRCHCCMHDISNGGKPLGEAYEDSSVFEIVTQLADLGVLADVWPEVVDVLRTRVEEEGWETLAGMEADNAERTGSSSPSNTEIESRR